MELQDLCFYLVILLANIVQGITGFAGTILAMPFALMLVGYDVAKPILNVLGFLSGVYVFLGNREKVNWGELKKIVAVMSCGILLGISVKELFAQSQEVLNILLGFFIIFLGLKGLKQCFQKPEDALESSAEAISSTAEENPMEGSPSLDATPEKKPLPWLLLFAGLVHGIFVSGGPLLIGYLSKIIPDKMAFRATISSVWIFLNAIIFFDDFRNGLWNTALIQQQIIAIPFLFVGMFLGTKLCKKMSQELFLKITYGLLVIAGCSLIL